MNYQKCVELWNGRRNATHRKVENNTYLELDGEDFVIELHGHPIIRHNKDGSVVYNSCGWQTVTTRDKMSQYGAEGYRIHQSKRIWYLGQSWNATYPFADGITVHPDGTVSGAGEDPKATQKLQKQVMTYAKDYVEELTSGNVGEPGPGDCFYCSMVTEDGTPLGDATHNPDHILSHLEEKYYVPSLLVNALKSGQTSIAANQTAYAYLYNKPEHIFPGDFLQKQIADVLTKYLRHQLKLA